MITFISSAYALEPNQETVIQFFTLVLQDGQLKFHHHCKNVAPGLYPVPRNVTYLDIQSPGDTKNANLAVLMKKESRDLFGQNHSEWLLSVSVDQTIELISKRDIELMKNL